MSRCSLHISDLCVCMMGVISEFDFEIERSFEFCALLLFLCYILCLMCSVVYLAFWNVVFVFVENDVCEDGVCSVYVWWCFNVREKQSPCL